MDISASRRRLLLKISKKHTMRGQLWSHGNIADSIALFHQFIDNFGPDFQKFDRMSLFPYKVAKSHSDGQWRKNTSQGGSTLECIPTVRVWGPGA
jgi:hypothetical protein